MLLITPLIYIVPPAWFTDASGAAKSRTLTTTVPVLCRRQVDATSFYAVAPLRNLQRREVELSKRANAQRRA